MQLEEQLLDRLGIYYIHFHIGERFGFTFAEYVDRYIQDATVCSVEQLTEKTATMAVVTA